MRRVRPDEFLDCFVSERDRGARDLLAIRSADARCSYVTSRDESMLVKALRVRNDTKDADHFVGGIARCFGG